MYYSTFISVFFFVGPKSPDLIPEVGEDAVNAVPCSPCLALTEEEQAELHSELAKVCIFQCCYISDSSQKYFIQWMRLSQELNSFCNAFFFTISTYAIYSNWALWINPSVISPHLTIFSMSGEFFYPVSLQVEDEIQTLSQVLAAKEKQVADIKRKLCITPLNEFKQNLSKGWHDVTTSTAYVPSLASGIYVPPATSRTAAEKLLHLSMLLLCNSHLPFGWIALKIYAVVNMLDFTSSLQLLELHYLVIYGYVVYIFCTHLFLICAGQV